MVFTVAAAAAEAAPPRADHRDWDVERRLRRESLEDVDAYCTAEYGWGEGRANNERRGIPWWCRSAVDDVCDCWCRR